jgi:hypothetical protein
LDPQRSRKAILSHLASWLPRYDYDEHHELPIAADVATVRRALVELDLGRIPPCGF